MATASKSNARKGTKPAATESSPPRTGSKAASKAAKKAPSKKSPSEKSAPAESAAQQAKTKPATTKATTTKANTTKATTTKAPGGAAGRSSRVSLATGARRAASEPRTASPLLQATAQPTTAQQTPGQDNPEPVERLLRVVPEPSPPSPSVGRGTGPVEGAVTALAEMLRLAANSAGLSTDEAEEQVARTLAYFRRRATGDFTVDEFGFDADFTDNVWLPLMRPIYEKWFRVEVRGIENIPASGGALVVANHSGTVPVDGLMTQVAIHDNHPAQRHMRMLGADLVFELPFVGRSARRTGSTLATAADAERLLRSGELVGVYPEGFKGVGKPFSERYKLQRFGRGGFVSAALRTGVPIIPCSIIGAEEIYPLIGNISLLARLMGAPYFPVTPFFPLLGPLGLIPLPSKWIIAFGEPLDTSEIGPAGAEDPMLVFDLTDQVRETIQQTLYALLMQRRSVFF